MIEIKIVEIRIVEDKVFIVVGLVENWTLKLNLPMTLSYTHFWVFCSYHNNFFVILLYYFIVQAFLSLVKETRYRLDKK